ncbi:hypothetical protein GIB67_040704 [Kingdonia uniflora]|uniref:beta-glucosidase n=1 Tax=Kingdonia uniflora TaxID=39325 RepID=A0A7J7KU99_9MAGN|nr:hypothetical protein GIB67_040704 [Kingdonia uniflora]
MSIEGLVDIENPIPNRALFPIQLGHEFKYAYEFRNVLIDTVIKVGFEIKFLKSAKSRIRVKYKGDNCEWLIYATGIQDTDKVQVRTFRDEHTCPRLDSRGNKMAVSEWVSNRISQVNGGTIEDKVDFAYGFFEKQVPIDVVFQKDEMIYIIGVTKGKGYEARVSFTVARAGHNGYHHRSEMNKKVYKLDKAGQESHSALTDFDKTEKDITPIGEFPHYGIVKENYLLIKGCCVCPTKGVATLRQSLLKQTSRLATENINLIQVWRWPFPDHTGEAEIMVPFNYTEFIDILTFQVKKNIIPMGRIDEVVRRILRVKFIMGFFEHPLADLSLVNQFGSKEHKDLTKEAMRKSLVLLKNGKYANKPLWPLAKNAPKILVTGSHADNLGNQCGGWTIQWQGQSGNDLKIGTTILQGIKDTVAPTTQVVYNETPDAEYEEEKQYKTISRAARDGIPLAREGKSRILKLISKANAGI